VKVRIDKSITPNIVTLSSLFCGFISIIMSGYSEIFFAALLIILAAFFDSIDGFIARKFKASSNFGKELDSLADVISFGLAPGYLLYQASLYKYGNLGIIVGALLPISAALRLARFNLKPSSKFFEGLPSTSAGLTTALLQGFYKFIPIFYLILAVVLSILMVSKLKYNKFDIQKFKNFIEKNFILLPFALLLIFIFFKWILLVAISGYIFSGLLNSLIYYYSNHTEKINI